jgi:hypothetical protein
VNGNANTVTLYIKVTQGLNEQLSFIYRLNFYALFIN